MTNMLVALYLNNNRLPAASIRAILAEGFSKYEDFSLGEVYVAYSKEEIDATLSSKKIDVLVCSDELGEDKIGTGSLKKWMATYMDLRIVLMLDDSKLYGSKFWALLGMKYYDMMFNSEFRDTGNLYRILSRRRTLVDIGVKYSLLENNDFVKLIEAEKKVNGSAEAIPLGTTMESAMEDSLIYSTKEAENLTFENDSFAKEPPLTGSDFVSEDESGANDTSDNAGDNLASLFDSDEDDEAAEDYSGEEREPLYEEIKYKNVENVSGERFKPSLHSGKGFVTAVIDKRTLIWESEYVSDFPNPESLTGTKCHLMIPYINIVSEDSYEREADELIQSVDEVLLPAALNSGSYKPSVVPISGIVICVLNRTSVLIELEIADMALIENGIINKETTLVRNMT